MHAWDTVIEGRDTLNWQIGRHSAKFGGSYRKFIWPMWGFFQNRGYYQFTNGFTTQYALNDGRPVRALASFELGLPAARQGQAGVPQMDLRQWYSDGYAQDAWRLTSTTTLTYGIRYEFMSPLVDIRYTNSNLDLSSGTPQRLHRRTERLSERPDVLQPHQLCSATWTGAKPAPPRTRRSSRLWHFLHAGRHEHLVQPAPQRAVCLPLTSQSDPFIPSINTLNFPAPVLGTTVVSFTGLCNCMRRRNTSSNGAPRLKSRSAVPQPSNSATSAPAASTLQRSHLINNAQPGPGLIQPRRPHPKISFVDQHHIPFERECLQFNLPRKHN